MYLQTLIKAGVAFTIILSGCHSGHKHERKEASDGADIHVEGEKSDGHGHERHEDEHDHEHDHEHVHDKDGVIKLCAHDAEELGVTVERVEREPFGQVLHVTGELEPSPSDEVSVTSKSAGIVRFSPTLVKGARVGTGTVLATISAREMAGGDANEISFIEMEAARKELDRLKPLYEEGIVSARDYNAAEKEYKRLAASYSGTRQGSSLTAIKGGIITDVAVNDGDFVDVGTRIATVSQGERLVIRADVPARDIEFISGIGDGTVSVGNNGNVHNLHDLGVKRLTDKAVTMSGGFIPVYFEIDRGDIEAVPGMVVDMYLTGEKGDEVITVKKESVSEQQGVHFVYVRLDEDCYKKQPVTVGRNDGHRVEIKSGLTEGMDVVSTGMIYVKLAESSGAVPEGHTHNH